VIDRVMEHSGRYSFGECPTLGCKRGREVRAQLDFPSGQRRVVTACEKHLTFYVARAITRIVAQRGGGAAVRAHVDQDLHDRGMLRSGEREWRK